MKRPQTTNSGQIMPRSDKAETLDARRKGNLVSLLTADNFKGEIERALPKHISANRMIRICITAVRTTRNLALCDQISFLACILQSAQLGLEPNTPLQHCFLIPRAVRNKAGQITGYTCTYMNGYQGMIELAYRSGRMVGIRSTPVFAGDFFEYELGLFPSLKHKPGPGQNRRDPNKLTHIYPVARVKDTDEPIFDVLDRSDIDYRRSRSSDNSGKGPWTSDYIAMARKSGIRAIWPYLPKSPEMARAEALEQAPELGRSQLIALDPEVFDALERQGLGDLSQTDDDVPDELIEEEQQNESEAEAETARFQEIVGELQTLSTSLRDRGLGERVDQVLKHAHDQAHALEQLRVLATQQPATGSHPNGDAKKARF